MSSIFRRARASAYCEERRRSAMRLPSSDCAVPTQCLSARPTWMRPRSARPTTILTLADAAIRTASSSRPGDRAAGRRQRWRRGLPRRRWAAVRSDRFASLLRISAVRGSNPPAAARAAAALDASGCAVGDCDLAGIDLARVRRAGLLIAEAEGARVHARLLSDPASGISQRLREALGYGAAQTPERIAQARAVLHEARQGLDALFASVDLLLLPTAPQTAFAFTSPAPSTQADFTALANAGGMPALSLAAGVSSGGLPPGGLLVGAPGTDALVLQAAPTREGVRRVFSPPPSRVYRGLVHRG